MLGSAKRLIDQRGSDELVVARAGEFAVHLDLGLYRVFAVLRDDLLVDLFVGVLDVAGVDVFGRPKVAL